MKNKTKGTGNLGPFSERAINLTHLIHSLNCMNPSWCWLNSTKVLQDREDFSILESFSYKLAKWNLVDKLRATRKVQLPKMIQILDSQYCMLMELSIITYWASLRHACCFKYLISFKPHNNSLKWVLLLPLFSGGRKRKETGSEGLSNLPLVTKLVSSRSSFMTKSKDGEHSQYLPFLFLFLLMLSIDLGI